MKKMLILLPFILVLGLTSCSNSQDKAYQRGYEAGYAEGRALGKSEGEKTAGTAIAASRAAITAAYQQGYNEGFEKGSEPFQPKGEVVKVLSYNLIRDKNLLWVKVVGEWQNTSNSTITAWLECALVDSAGQIVATATPQSRFFSPQERAFFTFDNFYQQPQAVDARFTITWQ